MISGCARPLPCCFSSRSRCASSSAQKRLLADVDAIERRLRQEDLAVGDQLRQVPVEERQQQRGDVVAVGIGVGEDDDLAVAQPREVEVLAHAAAERGDEIGQLLVLEHLGQRHPLGVHHLAAQRQDRLLARSRPCLADPPAESPSTTNSSLSSRPAVVQSLSLPGRFSRPVVAVLRVTSACAARLASRARAARMMRADDRFGDRAVVIQPVLERRTHGGIDRRR